MGIFSSFLNILQGYNYSNRAGGRGEEKIARKLDWISFFGREGKRLQNLYVPMPDGNTTEIDLLYITTKGIFVFESKDMAGYIFGNDRDDRWTVTLYAGKDFFGRKHVEKHHFYNPVRQNRTHIRFLKQYIGEDIQTFSMIVFSDRGDLKSIQLSEPDTCVCNRADLSGIMKDVWENYADVMTQEKVERIYSMLLPLTNVDEGLKQQHVQNIRYKYDSIMICPRCKGKLVLRTAKQGANAGRQFYGCSNYPRCRYIKNID